MMRNLSNFFTATAKTKHADIISIALLVAIWFVMIALVNPIGDFPLNDDWAYGWTVKTLLEKRDFQLSDWTATNLLSQVVWGAIFCLPFGFSFTALRLSTLTLGLIGVLATYGLLREVNASSKISLLGALIVTLNPIYFGLANSFNSDVPFFTFAILSLYFLVRGIRLNSIKEIIFGIVISFISILNRQTGLLILPAFGFAYLIKKGLNVKTIVKAFFPTVLGIALHLSYSYWLNITERSSILYNYQLQQLLKTFFSGFFAIFSNYTQNVLIVLVYLGLFLLPFLIVKFSDDFKCLSTRQKQMNLFISFFILATGIVLVAKDKQMPLVGNTLEFFGLGPQALEGYNSFLEPMSIALISRLWKVLTVIGIAGSVLLSQYFCIAMLQRPTRNHKNELDKTWLITLTISASLLYFVPIGGLEQKYWFDRYLLLFLPLLMMLVSILTTNDSKNRLGSGAVSISLIILLSYGGFTISATHDYLSSNRIRWQALDNLMQSSHILPNYIDGGFEFNGWYFGNKIEICNPRYQQSLKQTSLTWNDFTCLWGGDNYKYTVAFVPKAGYEVEKQYSFRRWLPWKEEKLYVLQKKTE